MPLISDRQELEVEHEAPDPHALPGMPDRWPPRSFARSSASADGGVVPCSVVHDSHSSCFRLQQNPSVKVPTRQKPKSKLGVAF